MFKVFVEVVAGHGELDNATSIQLGGAFLLSFYSSFFYISMEGLSGPVVSSILFLSVYLYLILFISYHHLVYLHSLLLSYSLLFLVDP